MTNFVRQFFLVCTCTSSVAKKSEKLFVKCIKKIEVWNTLHQPHQPLCLALYEWIRTLTTCRSGTLLSSLAKGMRRKSCWQSPPEAALVLPAALVRWKESGVSATVYCTVQRPCSWRRHRLFKIQFWEVAIKHLSCTTNLSPVKLIVEVISTFKVVVLHRPWNPPLVLDTTLGRGGWCSAGDLLNLVSEFSLSRCAGELMCQANLFTVAWWSRVKVHVVANNHAAEDRQRNTTSLAARKKVINWNSLFEYSLFDSMHWDLFHVCPIIIRCYVPTKELPSDQTEETFLVHSIAYRHL